MTERNVGIKNKIRFIAGLTLLFSLAFNACKKEDEYLPDSSSLITVTPIDDGVLDAATAIDLKWTAAGEKYNVYFGEMPIPSLYKSGVTSKALNVPVAGGRTYYWQIGTIDGNGKENLSAVYSFRVKVLLDLEKFTGLFDCNEPRYSHYDVNMSKAGKDTLQSDNFWDLQWKLSYVFDEMGNVKIVPATFAPDPTLKVSVTGTGTFDPSKNEFVVNYVVLHDAAAGNPLAIEIDKNTHTFTKK